ncbi:MAG: DUF3300 domain-containing protein [Methylophilaceae bacterium]
MLFKAVRTWVQLLLLLLCTPVAYAETMQDQPAQPAFSQQELDQMLAPIALYPDALLSQVLMAATYPLEIVQAARWSRANPGLKGDQAVKAVERNDWDPSVISLTAFPQILTMMDEKLDWTERLGDAFLAQQPQVMDTVQNLRQMAVEAGNLSSNDQIRVEPQGQTIVIVQATPQIVYVPYYDPMVVYGPWWWDAYPPVFWSPWPGYYQRPGYATGFFWGSGISISGGFFFGNFDWPRRHVHIVNVHNYYYSHDSNRYYDNRENRSRKFDSARNSRSDGSPHVWRHDPDHRRGVTYREPALQQQFGRTGTAAETRHDFNGRKPSSRDTINQQAIRPETGTAPRSRPETGNIRTERWNKAQSRDASPEAHSNAIDKPDRQDMPESARMGERSTITSPAAASPSAAPSSNSRLMPEQRSRTLENTGSRHTDHKSDIGTRPDTNRSDSNQRLDTRDANERRGYYRQQESAAATRDMPARGQRYNQQQRPKSHSDGNPHGDR